ncbi:MAG: monovalent cation/H(+) antiporter subunit G [Anaerolineae bacterium]|nr:monovalent cation/H(+) antiporter subunit G [Anaerolineae bacterium]MCO5206811.1 monovalent cation/H(+) antiporter subunit G [Anaerolineae bacterium]
MSPSALEITAAVLLVVGTLLMVVAGIGIMRMPDLYMRMSAATKASTVGAAALLLAAALSFAGLSVKTQVVATIVFLLVTAPVGAHVIARAAYRKRSVSLFERTTQDDLEAYYYRTRDNEPWTMDNEQVTENADQT